MSFSFVCFGEGFLQAYGPSMVPTINLTGDLILAERVSPRLGKVKVGDIVIVRSPVVPRRILTKRVLGMEGHRVTYLLDPKNSDEVHTVVVNVNESFWLCLSWHSLLFLLNENLRWV